MNSENLVFHTAILDAIESMGFTRYRIEFRECEIDVYERNKRGYMKRRKAPGFRIYLEMEW